MKVSVLADLQAISRKAAEIFLELAERSIVLKGRFTVAASGGSTPRGLYALLGSESFRVSVDWKRVHFFWVDERCVPIDSEESNFRLVFDLLLSRIPVPDSNIHRIRCEQGSVKGATDYEEEIKTFFGISGLPVFDLIILGMGEDGHTASLFPFSKSIEESARFVIPVHMEMLHTDRVTLTLSLLNNAAKILFLVAGRTKSNAVKAVLSNGQERKLYPAGLVNPVHGETEWLIDEEAAEKLDEHSEIGLIRFLSTEK